MTNEQKAKEIAEKIVGNNHYSYFDNFKQCALESMEWKDEQYDEERKELLELVKMIPVNEGNQTIVEDLINILEL